MVIFLDLKKEAQSDGLSIPEAFHLLLVFTLSFKKIRTHTHMHGRPGAGTGVLTAMDILFGVTERFRHQRAVVIDSSVNVLNTTELYI